MSRGRQTFKLTDLTKAIKGTEKAGRRVTSAAILPDGSIKLELGPEFVAGEDQANEWDSVK